MKASPKLNQDTKWVFVKQGTCSRTLLYILNREFDHPMPDEESAIDPMAGGIMQQGYQCGQLWGASMAVGAEAYRRTKNIDQTIGLAIEATNKIHKSFVNRAKSADCIDITEANFKKNGGIIKYMATGKFLGCFILADKWAPEAIQAAKDGLNVDLKILPENPKSCASEVVKKMGGTDEQIAMVAGFAGGIGLSGNGCGALSAAIWMNSLKWAKENPGKSPYNNPASKQTLDVFMRTTNYEFECKQICSRQFHNIKEHTDFLNNEGCKNLIATLSSS